MLPDLQKNGMVVVDHAPDLSPVDYKIWSVLQERVYQIRVRHVDHLKMPLVEEWNRFDQGIC